MTQPALLPFERRFRAWMEAQGMGWERASLPCGDGETTAAYRLTPRGIPRRTLVALHGAGNDSLFGWVGLFKRQLLAGSEILTFDLPGHGRGAATKFSPTLAREAVATAIAAATERGSAIPVHAIGVSLGGSVLLGSLPDVQDRLVSAVLIVAPLQIELSAATVLAELRPANVGLLWREREHYGLTGLIPSFGRFKRDIYPLRLESDPPPGAFGYITALNQALTSMELERAAVAIRIPVLLAYGARDRVVPLEQGHALSRLMEAAELFAVRRGTHLSTPLDPALLDRLDVWIEERSR